MLKDKSGKGMHKIKMCLCEKNMKQVEKLLQGHLLQ